MVPELSIVVPTYQRPEKLERALASIGPACTAPHEIVVVDDGAEGEGFAPARRFRARYLCKAGAERGLSASRNLGLKLARGRFLAFLDDDDVFESGGLDALLAVARGTEAIVHGDYFTITAEERQAHSTAGVTLQDLLVCNRLPVGSYLMRRGSIDGGFDEHMRSHEDWEFILRQLQQTPLLHVERHIVSIDKSANKSTSMQARRRRHFWLDYLSVYARYPAPWLGAARAGMLASLGVTVPGPMMEFEDDI